VSESELLNGLFELIPLLEKGGSSGGVRPGFPPAKISVGKVDFPGWGEGSLSHQNNSQGALIKTIRLVWKTSPCFGWSVLQLCRCSTKALMRPFRSLRGASPPGRAQRGALEGH